MVYPIIDQIFGKWISWQGKLRLAGDDACRPLFEPGPYAMVYEVLRVVDGLPLFWEDHMLRMERSLQAGKHLPDSLLAESMALISKNEARFANLRIVLADDWRVLHLTPSHYPDQITKEKGILTGLLQWERENPNIKSIRPDYKAAVAKKFAQEGPYGTYYELLLTDRQQYLTEGSRSNLFFIKDQVVYSAHDSKILLGITRKHVRQAITASGSVLAEKMLTLDDVRSGAADAAFITSSPIDILAIRAIEDLKLSSAVNPLLKKIDQAYQAIVKTYLASRSPGHTL